MHTELLIYHSPFIKRNKYKITNIPFTIYKKEQKPYFLNVLKHAIISNYQSIILDLSQVCYKF